MSLYQSFCFPLLVYRSIIAPLSLLFFLLHGLEAAFRSWEIKVDMGYLAQIIDTTKK